MFRAVRCLGTLNARNHLGFGNIRSDHVCHRTEKTHFGNKAFVNLTVKIAVVAHNGIDDAERVTFFEINQKSFYGFRLLFCRKVARVNRIKAYSDIFPMVGKGLHFVRKIGTDKTVKF